MKIDKDKLFIAKEKTEKAKGILFFHSWVSDKHIDLTNALYEQLRKDYFIVGVTTGPECISRNASRMINTYDIVICPSAPYAQSVMISCMSNRCNSIYPLHECLGKSKLPSRQFKKEYDAVAVMNLNFIKFWGVFCDLAEHNPKDKFLAILGQSHLEGPWSRQKEEYRNRLTNIPNIEVKEQLVHEKVIDAMAQSKMLFHASDYDPGAMVVGESLFAGTPVLINNSSSSVIRHLINPFTGMFFDLTDVFNRYDLMKQYIHKNKFKPEKWYRHHYGFENYIAKLEKYFRYYGILRHDENLNCPNDSRLDIFGWFVKLANNPIKCIVKEDSSMISVEPGSTIKITMKKDLKVALAFYWRDNESDCIYKYDTDSFKTKIVNVPLHARFMSIQPSTEIEKIENV